MISGKVFSGLQTFEVLAPSKRRKAGRSEERVRFQAIVPTAHKGRGGFVGFIEVRSQKLNQICPDLPSKICEDGPEQHNEKWTWVWTTGQPDPLLE